MDVKTARRRLWSASFLLLATVACRQQHEAHKAKADSKVPAVVRDNALARARVWAEPRTPIASADFRANPPGADSFDPSADVDCTFTPKAISGSTPKFFCTLPTGETLKVKYGEPNGEIPAEIAATRLLAALGFPTDRMYRVHSVKCRGCPELPQQALQCLAKGGPSTLCMEGASESRAVTFEHAAIERPFVGRKIEAEDGQGWSWYELDKIDPRAGGSPRAHVDALRLVAMLLAHWDNKGANQRLICAPGNDRPDGTCAAPLAMIQDLGSTFGPAKMNLPNWKNARIWTDPGSCRVSMSTFPFGGATFPDRQISEEGRQFALRLLRPLSRAQLDILFDAAGVSAFNHVLAEAHTAGAWSEAFLAKVDEIASAGPCASS